MPIGQDEDIRIYELPEAQELTAGMKVAVDSETDGTKSFDLSNLAGKVDEPETAPEAGQVLTFDGTENIWANPPEGVYVLNYSEITDISDIDVNRAKSQPTYVRIDEENITITIPMANSNSRNLILPVGTTLKLTHITSTNSFFFSTILYDGFYGSTPPVGSYGTFFPVLELYNAGGLVKGWSVTGELDTGNMFHGMPIPFTKYYANGRGPGSVSIENQDKNALTVDFQANGNFRRQCLLPLDIQNHDFSSDTTPEQIQFMGWGATSNRAGYRTISEVPASTAQDEGKVLTVDSNGAAAWQLAPTGKIAVFDGEKSLSSGTTWPDEVEVRAAIASGKYVVIRMTGVGGDDYYTIRWIYGYQYYFTKVGSTGMELRLERNTEGTAYEWSFYSEPVSPSAKIFTGTYNPNASPADYSGMPNTLSIESALNAGNDVVLMLTNPADSNVYAYRLVSNAKYTKRFMAIDNAAMSTGWDSVPGLMMTYAGPGNPWGWAMARYLTQELKTSTISESYIINYSGHCGVDNLNALTTMTLTSVNSVTMHTNNYNVTANNFTVEIDNTGNSNAVTVDVQHGPSSLKYSVAAGNIVGAGKYVQLICIGNCWRLEEFV